MLSTSVAAGFVTLPLSSNPTPLAPPFSPTIVRLRPVNWVSWPPHRPEPSTSTPSLDVSIASGKGSGSTAQLVASKATQFGFADGYVVGNGVGKGMAIKTVATIYRRDPAAVMVLDESPIKSPKDLEGKSVAMTAGSAQFQQWPAFAKGAGFDPAKVQIVNIDPAGVGPALVSGKADAIGGYVFSYAPSIEVRAKKKLRMFWFADYGVTIVSNGIIVHQDLLNRDPDLIRAFVPPSIKGFLYGRQHMDEAIAAVQKYQPTADPAVTKLEFELAWKTWLTPNTMGKPLGWAADADWAGTIEVLKQYGGVTAPLTTSQLYTNEFVPTGADYVPPQQS